MKIAYILHTKQHSYMIKFKSMSLFSLRGKKTYIDQFKIDHEIIKQLLIKENQ